MNFPYFVMKKAPVSGVESLMDYNVAMIGERCGRRTDLELKVVVPVTSLCPCSKKISDYGAHNQRADLRVQVVIEENADQEQPVVWIEEVIRTLEEAAGDLGAPAVKKYDIDLDSMRRSGE